VKRKIKFNCLCGHEEKTHNFDPDSVMFGCLYSVIMLEQLKSGTHRTTTSCQCREFRPDTLRYIEDKYEQKTL
jgi:hypothetical protein